MSAVWAVLFPGQGSQYLGMGQSLQREPLARQVFEEADSVLGFSLSSLCWGGPEAELQRTEFAQPAILAHSIAAFRVVESRLLDAGVTIGVMAGHSLGEWSALVAAGALPLAKTLELVRLRGRLMQEAVPAGQGAMAAILGLPRADIERACHEAAAGEVVVCAAHNDAANHVISGHAAAVARAGELCVQRGAMRAIPLAVSAPFHSPLMHPAGVLLAEVVQGLAFAPLRVPIRSTIVDATLDGTLQLGTLLVEQMVAPVLWQEAVSALATAGYTQAVACGPAAAVPGMVKRTARGLKVRVVAEALELEGFVV